MTDPNNPAVWWRHLLLALSGLHANNAANAKAYIAFVKEHRGEAASERARAEVKRYAAGPHFTRAEVAKLMAKLPIQKQTPQAPRQIEQSGLVLS